MEIIVQADSGESFKVEPQLFFDVDATYFDECTWQYCKDHAQLQRVDGALREMALYISDNSEYLDNLVRSIIEYGCSQDFVELIELAWNHHMTWLMIHR